MDSARRSLHLEVHASTSNLGPGFDFLGLSLGMHLRLRTLPADRGPGEHRRVGRGGELPWSPDEDLLLRAIRAYEVWRGTPLAPVDLRVDSGIPVGRGFGSSGAAVAAGLIAAAALAGDEGALGDRARHLVPLAVELEGHPDNATASLLGGCTLGVPHPGGPTVVRAPVHPGLGFAVAWPDHPLFTAEARAVLPGSVPFADAVENPRRLALLLEGLRTGDPALLALGVEDRLHERHRRALVEGSDAACAGAVAAGAFAACLSGAGSGLVAICPPGRADEVAAALAAPLRGGQGRAVPHVDAPPAPRWVELR